MRAGQPTAEPEQIDEQINDFESGWWILYCDPGRFVPHARQEPALAQSAHRVACFPGRCTLPRSKLPRKLPLPIANHPAKASELLPGCIGIARVSLFHRITHGAEE